MEVSVYMSLDSFKHDKSVFKRVVLCPAAFDVNQFVSVMKSIFGEKVIVNILFT